MAKKEESKTNELNLSYDGCYGSQLGHESIAEFLESNFEINDDAHLNNMPRFSQCIWGNAGTGKTFLVKEFKNKPTKWRGKIYNGWDVHDVPVAQFEEMGDLHGMPYRCCLMKSCESGEERWVPDIQIDEYKSLGYKIDTSISPQTRMAPPDWVPAHPKPSILLLDDWNRASVRIIKGIMQLLQNYAMVSWSLPPGCNIVLTGNPDQQDYLVTSLDDAILTRLKHITLKPDYKEWAIWAESQKLDARGIGWILCHQEMLLPKGASKRSNPRTIAEFCRILKNYPNLDASKDMIRTHADSLLDAESVASFFTYLARDVHLVMQPEDILDADERKLEEVKKHVEKIMAGSDPRIDILSVMCERLLGRILQPDCEPTASRCKNFQDFITMNVVPSDTRHSVCRRIAKVRDQKLVKWIGNNKDLRKLIMETLR